MRREQVGGWPVRRGAEDAAPHKRRAARPATGEKRRKSPCAAGPQRV